MKMTVKDINVVDKKVLVRAYGTAHWELLKRSPLTKAPLR